MDEYLTMVLLVVKLHTERNIIPIREIEIERSGPGTNARLLDLGKG